MVVVTITTVSDNQSQILYDIAQLHNEGRRYTVDLTFSTGVFWDLKNEGRILQAPVVRMDLNPQSMYCNLVADARALPFRPASVESIVFDPPFIHAPGKNSIIGQRFGGFKSQEALWHFYKRVMDEGACALKPGGILVFKCQDIVESGKQVWNHWKIMTYAFTAYDFTVEDLFILTKKGQIGGHNHGRQIHARRAHSYFIVMKRK